jgi:cytochrome P450
MGAPKKATDDMMCRGYRIKKVPCIIYYFKNWISEFNSQGTSIMANFHSLFFEEEVWGYPEVFRSTRTRYLDTNGNVDAKITEIVVAFGAGEGQIKFTPWPNLIHRLFLGKRNCFGEVVGRDSMFLFITTLVQKFKFDLPAGSRPNVEPICGLTLYAHPYDA